MEVELQDSGRPTMYSINNNLLSKQKSPTNNKRKREPLPKDNKTPPPQKRRTENSCSPQIESIRTPSSNTERSPLFLQEHAHSTDAPFSKPQTSDIPTPVSNFKEVKSKSRNLLQVKLWKSLGDCKNEATYFPVQPTRSVDEPMIHAGQGCEVGKTEVNNYRPPFASVASNDKSVDNEDHVEKVPIRPRKKAPLNMSTILLLETYRNLTKTFNNIYEQEMQEKKAKKNFYPVQKNEILGSKYRVLDFIGKGSFGQVVKAEPVEVTDPQPVAIKIIRKSAPFLNQGRREVQILNTIKSPDKSTNFTVQIIEHFMHDGHLCIVFELLSHSLLDLVNLTLHADPTKPGLSLRMVHKLSHQLVCVLATLANMEIIHCDLKPENVALSSPNKAHIKVLDFGNSCHSWENVCNLYPYIQSRFYRAPEILLGCRYGFPIDMWSLGCVIVELYTARPLFAGRDSIEQLYCIMDVLGPPPQSMLEQAVYLKRYFKHADGKLYPKRKFKWKDRKLKDLISVKPENSDHLDSFFDLIQKMLTYDPSERITPYEALNHPFILYGPARAKRPSQVQPHTLDPNQPIEQHNIQPNNLEQHNHIQQQPPTIKIEQHNHNHMHPIKIEQHNHIHPINIEQHNHIHSVNIE